MTPAPVQDTGLWKWFAGGSVGYLTDQDEAMYSLHAGMEYRIPDERGFHAIYLQVGFTQDDADYSYFPNIPGAISQEASIDVDIIPITLNYKYEVALTERLNGYLGIGAGIAIVDGSYDWSWSQAVPPPNNEGDGSDDWSDVRFYGEVFAGLSYEISDSFELYTGLRYIFMDEEDREIDVTDASDYEAGIDQEFLVELGVRWHF